MEHDNDYFDRPYLRVTGKIDFDKKVIVKLTPAVMAALPDKWLQMALSEMAIDYARSYS